MAAPAVVIGAPADDTNVPKLSYFLQCSIGSAGPAVRTLSIPESAIHWASRPYREQMQLSPKPWVSWY